ncbi:alpha/beta fold hydrolase [Microbacterium sp. YY-01]|uniref:alpha/beta fold hydrolase n=1 Tax=Microbacterium sp. YY-01 TaxID=3421634 RepID=UPI003D17E797
MRDDRAPRSEASEVHVILVPGLWLDGSTWDAVDAQLAAAGLVPHPVTLQGLTSRMAPRSGLMLADHVAEVVSAIDRYAGRVMLVGHAEACGIVHAAVNRRPERVMHAVYINGFPSAHGTSVLTGFTHAHDRLEPAVRCLDSVQRLTDPRRFTVPVTLVSTQIDADDVRRWIALGEEPAGELARMTDVTVVSLTGGRWPHMEQSDAVAQLLIDAAGVNSLSRLVP